MSLEPNQDRILANRYHLVELVGTGAMGQVYRAEDQLLGEVTVAIKFLSQTLLNDKMRRRFEREATISALLGEKSIHIVKVRDYGVDENEVPYYVMEFLEGESLSETIRFEPLPLSRFLSITRQICLGMDSAHKGIMLKGELCRIVHRDIKPSNILVMEDPSLGELVKILDFGIARLIQANITQTHSFMGTLAYCSPEQMEGKELDNRSDIYSLGVMMYEMLTIEMPIFPENSSFGGWYKAHHDFEPRPFDAHLNLPLELKRVIMKCMAKSPDARPQTVGEILTTIEALEQNNPKIIGKNTTFSGKETIAMPNDDGHDNSRTSTQASSRESLEGKLAWPKNKPQQKIVFPRVITTSRGETFASLWVMLEQQDIQNRISSLRYNQFLFLSSPHPMLLWITVIYNSTHGPRWLPCYLDLKKDTGQHVAATLAELGSYKIFFFALEEPEHCMNTMTATIASSQCNIMQDWLESSKNLPSSSNSKASKKRLRKEFQKLKPKILMKLEER